MNGWVPGFFVATQAVHNDIMFEFGIYGIRRQIFSTVQVLLWGLMTLSEICVRGPDFFSFYFTLGSLLLLFSRSRLLLCTIGVSWCTRLALLQCTIGVSRCTRLGLVLILLFGSHPPCMYTFSFICGMVRDEPRPTRPYRLQCVIGASSRL